MEAYGEGFEILSNSPSSTINLHQVAAVWNRGSVVRSWLLELAEQMLAGDATLRSIHAVRGGLGRGAVDAAGGDRGGGLGPGDRRVAVRAVRVARPPTRTSPPASPPR
jgi:hypothetical protein